MAWIWSHHLHLHWKFKLLAGKFTWGEIRQNIAGWCQQTFCFQKFVDITQQCFALLPQVNFHANSLNFHSRWRWWDQIQAIFLNLFYFNLEFTYETGISGASLWLLECYLMISISLFFFSLFLVSLLLFYIFYIFVSLPHLHIYNHGHVTYWISLESF